MWYQSCLKRHSNQIHFVDFKREFIKYFEPLNPVKKARDRLATLRQTGALQSYVNEFRELTNQATDMTETEKLDRIVRGLKPRTRMEVEVRDPKTLDDAIVVADRIETIFFGRADFNYTRDYIAPRNRSEPRPAFNARTESPT